jgi:hypothetical protein
MAAEGDPLIGGNLLFGIDFLRAEGIELNNNGEYTMNNRVEPMDFHDADGTAAEGAGGHVCNEEMAASEDRGRDLFRYANRIHRGRVAFAFLKL